MIGALVIEWPFETWEMTFVIVPRGAVRDHTRGSGKHVGVRRNRGHPNIAERVCFFWLPYKANLDIKLRPVILVQPLRGGSLEPQADGSPNVAVAKGRAFRLRT